MSIRTPLAVVGGGRMGDAIVFGLLAAGTLAAAQIIVAEPDSVRRGQIAERYGVRCVGSGSEAVRGAGTVLLAVKPQVIGEVVQALADDLEPEALVVSIAAGVPCARLEALLQPGAHVVRVMPNTPALVRQGMTVVSGGTHAAAEETEAVRDVFAAIGDAVVLEERFQDAATAVSGSGPAYVAIFIEALADAGERQGLPHDIARRLATRTVRGTVELLDATGQEPQALVDAVSSPGGTTLAAIGRLDADGFRETIDDAVAAAVARAKELGA